MKVDSVILSPTCVLCAVPSAHIEIVAPEGYPHESQSWSRKQIKIYEEHRDLQSYYLLYEGPGGGNGMIGDPISLERVELLTSAFSKPYDEAEMKEQLYDMAGYCVPCQEFYCRGHWNPTTTGGGTCPEGHWKSLDPHWSPESF